MKLTILLMLILAAGTSAEFISIGQACREKLSASNDLIVLLELLENKDLFRFSENYDNTGLNDWERTYINALILNLRHKNFESNRTISEVLEKYGNELHDSLKMQLFETRMKNSVNLFDYKDALYCTEYVFAELCYSA